MINGINIRIIGAFFAVIVLSSCGKTYTGEVESSGNGIGTSDEDIPVMLAVSDPSMLTRGSGAFDKELGMSRICGKNPGSIYMLSVRKKIRFSYAKPQR